VTERPGVSVELLITIVAAGASVALAVAFGGALSATVEHPVAAATFLALALLLQLISMDAYGRGSVSASAVGFLASGIALGPGVAMIVALVALAEHWVRRRGVLHRTLFDAGNFVLSALAGTLVYEAIVSLGDALLVRVGAAVLAGVAYNAVNNGLLCLAMSLAESLPARAVWKERFQWASAHYLAYGPLALASVVAYEKIGTLGVAAFALPPALLAFSMHQYLARTREAVEEVRRSNDELERANAELKEMADRVRKTHRDTIAALSRSMEAKDYYTGSHTERVSQIAVALARRLGYQGEELHAIEIGALLHDVGKIGVPERILHKPAPLDEDEWKVMKEHPLISEFILAGIDLHPLVLQIARSSHERIDGAGYPDGLDGDAIPLPARIVLVADAWDALTSTRPYRAARRPPEALAELRANTATQFCARVMEVLEALYHEEPNVLLGAHLRAVDAA
jgi:HD domain